MFLVDGDLDVLEPALRDLVDALIARLVPER